MTECILYQRAAMLPRRERGEISQKRRRFKKLKGGQLKPLEWTEKKHWYRSLSTLITIGFSRLCRIFQRPERTSQELSRRR